MFWRGRGGAYHLHHTYLVEEVTEMGYNYVHNIILKLVRPPVKIQEQENTIQSLALRL